MSASIFVQNRSHWIRGVIVHHQSIRGTFGILPNVLRSLLMRWIEEINSRIGGDHDKKPHNDQVVPYLCAEAASPYSDKPTIARRKVLRLNFWRISVDGNGCRGPWRGHSQHGTAWLPPASLGASSATRRKSWSTSTPSPTRVWRIWRRLLPTCWPPPPCSTSRTISKACSTCSTTRTGFALTSRAESWPSTSTRPFFAKCSALRWMRQTWRPIVGFSIRGPSTSTQRRESSADETYTGIDEHIQSESQSKSLQGEESCYKSSKAWISRTMSISFSHHGAAALPSRDPLKPDQSQKTIWSGSKNWVFMRTIYPLLSQYVVFSYRGVVTTYFDITGHKENFRRERH